MRSVVGVWILVLGLAVPALAQRTTGSIVGVATDESGGVLPGVTVTLTGPNVAGQPTTVTGSDGA